tara:strand:- start:30 stop:212 length:183 start_codon:yes stop_codon:yes gene_type:complete
MTVDFGDVNEGDVILFNHGDEVWKGYCMTKFSSSMWVEVNNALVIEIRKNDIVEVVKREV